MKKNVTNYIDEQEFLQQSKYDYLLLSTLLVIFRFLVSIIFLIIKHVLLLPEFDFEFSEIRSTHALDIQRECISLHLNLDNNLIR